MTRPPAGTATQPIDLAIVGVPKAGTTSLYTWLAEHPGVQGSEPKETLYFIERDSKLLVATQGAGNKLPTFQQEGWDGFERFFPEPREGRLRLEASPSNLYHETPLAAFSALRPQPLVMVALRCPAEQIRSAFYFAQNNGAAGSFIDQGLGFPTYVAALLEGNLEPLKDAIPDENLRWYVGEIQHHNRYVEWLDRWAAKIEPENLMVLRFDDISSRPYETVTRICERVGLDPSIYDGYEFTRINPTLARPASRTRQLAAAAGRMIPQGQVRDALVRVYRKVPAGQYIGAPSADETAAMMALGEYFAPYNQALSERYGIDVAPWWPVRAASQTTR